MYLYRHVSRGDHTDTSAAFLAASDGLCVTLVVHPGLVIENPLEADGRAVRLWPDPPQTDVDLRALPELPHSIVAWHGGGLAVSADPGVPLVISPSANMLEAFHKVPGPQKTLRASAPKS